MRVSAENRVFSWVTLIVFAGVLLALGIMQYRWSGEVSEAASTRMQANLQSSLMDFRQDLARELARICLEMQETTPGQGLDARRLTQKLLHWQRTASHPGLIAQVYLMSRRAADRSEDTTEQFSTLRLADDHFELVDTPPAFATLSDRLGDIALNSPSAALVTPSYRDGSPSSLMAPPKPRVSRLSWVIDQHIPALIYPVQQAGSGYTHTKWLVIQLDAELLRNHILPELAERYLADSSGLVYQVAVVDTAAQPMKVVYSSDPGFGEHGGAGRDASLNFFGPPFFQMGGARSRIDLHRRPVMPSRERFSSRGGNDLEGSVVRLDPFHYSAGDRDWEVMVKHRKGSMEAAVSGMRRRNLALSFGVLLVLAGTMVLIVANSQRARRLAQLQMDFVAGVSHELRTPLSVISSAAENIADGVVADPQQMARYGIIIRDHARQLADLIEQVLGFATLRKPIPRSSFQPMHVTDAVEAALQNAAADIAAAGITVDQHIAPGLPRISADFGLLTQCLQNLIANAVKYGGERRWLGIEVSAGEQPHGNREVVVTVEDRGIGVAGDELETIFQPFYRSPAVAESRIHGTGLGLPLARASAERMGGRLTVCSSPGKGSRFSLHLPALAEADANGEAGAEKEDRSEVRDESCATAGIAGTKVLVDGRS